MTGHNIEPRLRMESRLGGTEGTTMKAGAWVKQIASQVAKYGEEAASWYCEWDEPDGTRRIKSCGPGKKGRKAADKMAERLRAELLTGTYNRQEGATWEEFRGKYLDVVVSGLAERSRPSIAKSLNHFERILHLKEKTVAAVTTERVADFVAARRKERGKKPGSRVSPATINSDLRHIKAALRMAEEWGYIDRVPVFKPQREPERLQRYVTPEHFAAIYKACDVATQPDDMHVPPAEWWRTLMAFLMMTGWRVGAALALRWRDVDLQAGTVTTRARDNKGKRDAVTPLSPALIELLKPLQTFDPRPVFPWEMDRTWLTKEFHRIQKAAGVDLPCRVTGRTEGELESLRDAAKRQDRRFVQGDEHECTPACHKYGFHSERYAFATLNAESMSTEALQALMHHKSRLTTERYINFARQLKPAADGIHVPEVLQMKTGS